MRGLRQTIVVIAILFISLGLYQEHVKLSEQRSDISHINFKLSDFNLSMLGRLSEQQNQIFQIALELADIDLSVLNNCGLITDGYGHGSCVAIGPDLILTAKHCLGHEGAWIEIDGACYNILSEWGDDKYDVGFIRIDGDLHFCQFGLEPELLDIVYVVGTPENPAFINNISKGIVSNLNVDWDLWPGSLIVDAASWGGNSGGPVFNQEGRIIGILVGGPFGSDSISVCVPVYQIEEALSIYQAENPNTEE